MTCPLCNNILQNLSVTTAAGITFNVKHCGRCGGTWFDPFEIHRVPYHEVVRIANITVSPKKPSYTEQKQFCPRDKTRLTAMPMDALPPDVSLLRCAKCHGIWATQRSLEGFKKLTDTPYEQSDTHMLTPALSVIFIPAVSLFLLFAGSFATLSQLQNSQESRIRAQSLVKNVSVITLSPTSVSITFETSAPQVAKISYGTSPFTMISKPVSQTPKQQHAIILTDLTPRATYIYKVTFFDENGKEFSIPLERFVTTK